MDEVDWNSNARSRVKYSGLSLKESRDDDWSTDDTGSTAGFIASRQPPLAIPHRADATIEETGRETVERKGARMATNRAQTFENGLIQFLEY